MELNWTTFIFEIINFLVLVWILKIFFYQPVLKALNARRNAIANSLAEAQALHEQATELEQKYHSRLDDWDLEKQQLLDQLQQDIQQQRSLKLQQLEQELGKEREKAVIVEQRQQAEVLKHYQQKAHHQGSKFASRLLTAIASPELEQRLLELFLNQMDHLSEDHHSALISAGKTIKQIVIGSAYALTSQQQTLITDKLNALCETKLNYNFIQQPELLSGLRINIGDWVLRFNLRDELISFSDLNHENPVS